MSRAVCHLFLLLGLIMVCVACQGPKASEQTSPFRYQNTPEFVFEQAKSEVLESWRIASEDEKQMTLMTEWNTLISPRVGYGRRHRLKIVVVGDPKDGVGVNATQESESNENEKDPSNEVEAEWTSIASDGVLATRYLINLHARMNPPKTWKQDAER